MNDLDELADTVWGMDDNTGRRRRANASSTASPMLWLLLVVFALLSVLFFAQRADPDFVAGLGVPIQTLAWWVMVILIGIFVIAMGVRIGMGGRR